MSVPSPPPVKIKRAALGIATLLNTAEVALSAAERGSLPDQLAAREHLAMREVISENIVPPDDSSPLTLHSLGCFVPPDVSSPPDASSPGRFVLLRFESSPLTCRPP